MTVCDRPTEGGQGGLRGPTDVQGTHIVYMLSYITSVTGTRYLKVACGP